MTINRLDRAAAHASSELWLHPLSIRKSQFRNGAAFELFQAGSQFGSVVARESDKGRTSVSQPLRIGLSKQCEGSLCLSITGSADDHERAFGKAFSLEPGLAASASVF